MAVTRPIIYLLMVLFNLIMRPLPCLDADSPFRPAAGGVVRLLPESGES